ncbi:MAG: histidinol phosphate phosphatase domain-containing protein [Desulfonatronovibrionaceae bacterium]
MIDLHTHTVYSDGELIPSELARRAGHAGYRGLAFTDHVDHSNVGFILSSQLRLVHEYSIHGGIELLAGVELTHVPPPLIADCAAKAAEYGAQLVIVHGETVVEPVEAGTNLAAIEAGVDILAHPGLITEQEARLAADKGVFLEITTRKGHSLTNGHVLNLARRTGAGLVMNNDTHGPGDLLSGEMRRRVGLGAGMTEEELARCFENSRGLFRDKMLRR